MSKESASEVKHGLKDFKIGQIEGGTQQENVHLSLVKMRGQDDTNAKIDSKEHDTNKYFHAIDNGNIGVKKVSPIVSIIVPVYNAQNELHRCVDSILSQTFNAFELILVNDGSSDNCGHICDEYALVDDRVVVIHQKNQGVGTARNAGLNAAKGKYIGFVDADDYIESDFLALMIKSLESNNADLVMCDYSLVENGKQTRIIKCKFPDSTIQINKEEILKNITEYKSNGYASVFNKLYRREIIINNNLSIPQNISLGEDLIFNISYFNCISFANHINKPIYNYLITDEGLFRKFRREYIRDCMTCRQLMFESLKNSEHYDPGFPHLNERFLLDIFRYISSVYKNEPHPQRIVSECYRNSQVKDCMVQFLKQYNSGYFSSLFNLAQFRIAKWISTGIIPLAVWYTDYLYNHANLVRKLRDRYKLFLIHRRDKNLNNEVV